VIYAFIVSGLKTPELLEYTESPREKDRTEELSRRKKENDKETELN